jgi:hypothetical protein
VQNSSRWTGLEGAECKEYNASWCWWQKDLDLLTRLLPQQSNERGAKRTGAALKAAAESSLDLPNTLKEEPSEKFF